MSVDLHIQEVETYLKDGYGNVSVMAAIIIKYYIFLTKIITYQLAWTAC